MYILSIYIVSHEGQCVKTIMSCSSENPVVLEDIMRDFLKNAELVKEEKMIDGSTIFYIPIRGVITEE